MVSTTKEKGRSAKKVATSLFWNDYQGKFGRKNVGRRWKIKLTFSRAKSNHACNLLSTQLPSHDAWVPYNINRSSALSRYFHWTGSNHRKLFGRPAGRAAIINLPGAGQSGANFAAIYNLPFIPLRRRSKAPISWPPMRNWIKSPGTELTEHRKRTHAHTARSTHVAAVKTLELT